MHPKGPKVGPFRSLFAPFLVTTVCQIDYKGMILAENESFNCPSMNLNKTLTQICNQSS